MSNPVPSSLALSVINTSDPINSAPHRNNYAAIQSAVNQLIACLSGGTAGQRLQAVDGTDVAWVNQITYRKTTAKQVVNSVAETDLLNGEITVGAGVLGTNGCLRLTAWGNSSNNTGATQATPRLKLKLGASTLIDTGSIAATWATSTARYSWKIEALILNQGATNVQTVDFRAELEGAGANTAATLTLGTGRVTGDVGSGIMLALADAAGAVDTTAALALALSVILPTANANCDMTLSGALVEII